MISLLWPQGAPPPVQSPAWLDDLDLDPLLQALDPNGRHHRVVREVLLALTTDVTTIRYRQEILADLLNAPDLRQALQEQLRPLGQLATVGREPAQPQEPPLLTAARRIGELELYVDTVQALQGALQKRGLKSEGLRALRSYIETVASEPVFLQLAAELPALRKPLEQMSSITVGINLDEALKPIGATLLSINDSRFLGKQGLLARLFGPDSSDGLTPLRARDPSAAVPFLAPLFHDLGQLVADTSRELANRVSRFSRIAGGGLSLLQGELGYLLAAADLVERVRAARLPLTNPVLHEMSRRQSHVEGIYDMSLALRLLAQSSRPSIVVNELALGPGGRVALLTGPNRGGKSTYLRAVGLAHVMAQAGLPVPARAAELSPCDAIHTQFASGERHTIGFGRFDEEVRQLATIFDKATPDSLILMNEPLSGTNPEEALPLARGVVNGLQQLGARAIVATHLLALARETGELTSFRPDEPVFSLVASPPDSQNGGGSLRRSFRVVPGPPIVESRALEIATQHGVSPEQIINRVRARGL